MLIENAIKFTREGSIIFRFRLTNEEDNKVYGTFEVEDTGYGIDDEQKKNIFKVLGNVQFRNQINIGGAGTGLTFSKKLTELIGGEISFLSIKNIGSTFKLKLECGTLPHQQLQQQHNSEASSSVVSRSSKNLEEVPITEMN